MSFEQLADTPALIVAAVVSDEQGRVQELPARGTLIDAVWQQVARSGASTADVLERARAKYRPDDPSALEKLVSEHEANCAGRRISLSAGPRI